MKKWYNAFWAFLLALPWLWALVALRAGATLSIAEIYAPFFTGGVMPIADVFSSIRDAFPFIWGSWSHVIFPLQWAFTVFVFKLLFDLLTIVPRLLQGLGRRWFKEDTEL